MAVTVQTVNLTPGLIGTDGGAYLGTGKITFSMPEGIVDSDGNVVVPTIVDLTMKNGLFTSTVYLDGYLPVLLASDDPSIFPTGWQYEINVALDVWTQVFRAAVPAASPTTTLGALWKSSPDNPANQTPPTE